MCRYVAMCLKKTSYNVIKKEKTMCSYVAMCLKNVILKPKYNVKRTITFQFW